MKKKNPIFGFLSVSTWLFGVIGIYLAIQAHSEAGSFGAIIFEAVAVVGGSVFASLSFIRKESYVFLPVCGLIMSIGLLIFDLSR